MLLGRAGLLQEGGVACLLLQVPQHDHVRVGGDGRAETQRAQVIPDLEHVRLVLRVRDLVLAVGELLTAN